jgi:hypothetical protein
VAVQLPYYPKVEGLMPGAIGGYERKKMTKQSLGKSTDRYDYQGLN